MLKQTVQKLRQYEMDFMEIAKGFPAASPALRQAAKATSAALRQIIANPGSPEPAAPNTNG